MPYRLFRRIKHTISLLLLVVCLVGVGIPVSEAKKKKSKGPSEADLKKSLESIDKDLFELVKKSQSRTLFSPEETGALTEIRFELVDLMNHFPGNPMLTKPVYQAGRLYIAREMWKDAYEVYEFLSEKYPDNPYGLRAKSELTWLVRQKGSEFFPATEVSMPSPEAAKEKK